VQAFDAAGNQVPLEEVTIPEPSLRSLVLCALVLLRRVHFNRRSAMQAHERDDFVHSS
jgi:hypothetical protein